MGVYCFLGERKGIGASRMMSKYYQENKLRSEYDDLCQGNIRGTLNILVVSSPLNGLQKSSGKECMGLKVPLAAIVITRNSF